MDSGRPWQLRLLAVEAVAQCCMEVGATQKGLEAMKELASDSETSFQVKRAAAEVVEMLEEVITAVWVVSCVSFVKQVWPRPGYICVSGPFWGRKRLPCPED